MCQMRKGSFWGVLCKKENCFAFGKIGHKVRDSLNLKGQEKGAQAQANVSSDDPKKNLFYALLSRGEQETFPDMVTGMLKDYY